jgi:hypothetical protein
MFRSTSLSAVDRGMSIPRFAEGGLVQGGGGRGGAMDLKLGIGIDHRLVLKHLESKAAAKALQRGQ